jgi:hypothetical protein
MIPPLLLHLGHLQCTTTPTIIIPGRHYRAWTAAWSMHMPLSPLLPHHDHSLYNHSHHHHRCPSASLLDHWSMHMPPLLPHHDHSLYNHSHHYHRCPSASLLDHWSMSMPPLLPHHDYSHHTHSRATNSPLCVRTQSHLCTMGHITRSQQVPQRGGGCSLVQRAWVHHCAPLPGPADMGRRDARAKPQDEVHVHRAAQGTDVTVIIPCGAPDWLLRHQLPFAVVTTS